MKIVAIRRASPDMPTFDLNVEGSHTYTLANGVVVHNSSKSCSTTNGIYPIRALSLVKTDGETSSRWVAPEATKLADKYEIAWDISNEDHIKTYGIFNYWLDQTISADLYADRSVNKEVKMLDLIKEVALMVKYGVPTRYYYNSKTESDSAVAFTKTNLAAKQAEEDDGFEEGDSCGSGGCTL